MQLQVEIRAKKIWGKAPHAIGGYDGKELGKVLFELHSVLLKYTRYFDGCGNLLFFRKMNSFNIFAGKYYGKFHLNFS